MPGPPDWPSPLAWELLDEFEEDPHGISYLDVDKLLEEWGVSESLPGPDPIAYRMRIHPSAPNFIFSYPLRNELAPASVIHICRALRELHRRLT